ncbi:MAG: hypothetical protein WA208_05125, partial [Thermoanaerobaculia bacterium]
TCAPTRSLTRTFTVPVVDTCAQNPAPAITAPSDGTTATADVTFTWTPAAGAIGYRIVVSVNGGAPQDIGSTTTATTLTSRLTAGTIAATVEALFSGCPVTRSASVSFTVATPDPCEGRTIPVLTAPIDATTVSTASVQFTWLSVENASEYRVVILEHAEGEDEVPEEVGRTSGTELSVSLEPGTMTWWVEALFKGCPSTTSAERTFTIPPAHVCPTDAAALISPPDKANTNDASITFRWNKNSGAIGYELWAIYAGGTPTLIESSDAGNLTVTRKATAGATEWFVRTLYDRCPFVDSEHRTFTNDLPPDCSGTKAAVLLTPGEGEEVTSPVNFRWTPVPGATNYELYYTSSGSGAPTRLYSGTTVPFTPLPVPAGSYRWYVRTEFDRCGDHRSTQSRITVLDPPPACQALGTPTISSPAEITSGIRFSVRWTEVPGATSYVVQVANESDFEPALSASIDAGANSYELEQVNRDAQPRALYVRIRAVDTRCTTQQSGLYSVPAIIYVLPEVTNDATIPASEAQTLTYQLPLGPELAGRSFTAVPNQSWLTVTPASGVVPVGGMFLTVTAAALDLPSGTSIGGITVTLTDAAAGNVAGHGTTTYTTPISVNLVSPVTSTAKTSPPPDALIIPAVAHASGVN